MPNQPELVFEQVGNLLVMLHTRKPPTDAEWAGLLDHLAAFAKANGGSGPPGLSLTDGGNPTMKQREAFDKILDVRQLRSAVVSGASSVRFVVSTIALFSENIRSFPLSGLDDAFAWLGLSTADQSELRRVLARMARAPGAERFEALRGVLAEGAKGAR